VFEGNFLTKEHIGKIGRHHNNIIYFIKK